MASHELDLGHVPCTFSLEENLQGLSWGLCLISSWDPWGRPVPPEAQWAPCWQMAESGPGRQGGASGTLLPTVCPCGCSHVRVCVSECLTDPRSEMPSGVPPAPQELPK